MFAGIQAALKSEIQSSIHTAAKNLENPFAVKVLKALFLVKYVEEFKPTLRNIRVLMQSHFQCDLPALDRDLETALNLLEREVYIQRHGELYDFLTDEEKQVEQAIRSVEVDNQDIADELNKIIFDQLIKNNKIRCDAIKHDYSFTRKLDDRIFGRERELAIHVVTPFHPEYEKIDSVKLQAMGRFELLVVLPAKDRLIQDLTRYLQTSKYISQNISVTQKDSIKRILGDKAHANKERHANLVDEARDLLVAADLFVANDEVESGSKDPQTRINEGFEQLVAHVYTNLKMLRGVSYSDTQIESFVQGNDTDLFGGTELSEAESEMLNYIQRKKSKGMATSIKTLVEAFEQRPYGWPLAAIQCVLAKLCGRHKVDATSDSESLEGGKLTESIKKTQRHGNVLLEPQTVYAPSQIRKVKDFINEFFDVPAKSNEPKTLGAECAERFKGLHEILNDFHLQQKVYPFVGVLAEPVRQCKEYSTKTFKFFFDDFSHDVVDGLHAVKEETLEPMREFMSGKGVEIYTEGTTFLAEQGANLRGWAEPVVPARHPLTNARPSKPAATYPGDSIMQSIPLLPNVKGDSRTSVR